MTFFSKRFNPCKVLIFSCSVKCLGLIFPILVAALGVRAGVILNEPFSYTNGPLVTVSAGLWVTHSGTPGQVEVLNGRADLSAPDSEDVNTLLAGQPYAATTNTVLYASFTVNFSVLPSSAGEYFAHFKDSTVSSGFRAKIFGLTSGAGTNQLRLGIANGASVPAAVCPTNLNLNTDYRVYIRYGISNATTTLWINPTSEASASFIANDSTSAKAVVAFALRQNSGMGYIALDDLRVGTTFADVYVAPVIIPPSITQQPASISTIEAGAATFVAAAAGSDPLSYQWKFSSNSIAGATNATLILTNVTLADAGQYSLTVTNAAGSTSSAPATLTVITPNPNGLLSLVTYNVKGNFASDWSTNAPQVQAIARELQYLNPDVITLNEIPNGLRYEMTNWMTAFFPTYQLAVSPGTDGSIRSGVISRYPIARSQSWLDGASLTNFGYNGTYTRDLFEAEITVPGANEPLHVFTTHLKSGPDTDSQSRRAAECNAVSNFFVTVFLSSNAYRPYLLTGDLNEDISIPMSQNLQAIQRLISPPTGLRLTTPLNPFTLADFTHSIQGSLDARFDYVMPAGVLASNIVAGQVFRTDLLPPPLPTNLNSNDDIIASDHLPVQMIFNYPDPPLHLTLTSSNQSIVLHWPALIGRRYRIETSADFASWTVMASNLVALTGQQAWTSTAAAGLQFYRVVRVP